MKIGNVEIDFKPEIGNVDHIRIVEMIGDIHKKMSLLKKKNEAKVGAETLEKEIQTDLMELENQVKFINRKK